MSKSLPFEARLDDGRSFKIAPSDWIGEGGEGAVYRKNDLAIKIIEDRSALARKEPKLRLFKSIRHPQLATPKALAFDSGGALIGYAMDLIEGAPLARWMSPAWRSQNSLGSREVEQLSRGMISAIQALHAHQIWGGDLNELNWKVQGATPILIDCDSWGAPGYPVSAMMPTIADPRAGSRFEAASDWYALAILLFTLHAGIHPFRGSLPGYGPKDMASRMKDGASMFRDGAGWPQAAAGPDAIPRGLRDWMLSTLEGDTRSAPPSGDWSKAARARKAARASGELPLPSGFARWASPGVAQLEDGSWFDPSGAKLALQAPRRGAWRWLDPDSGHPWEIWQEGSRLMGRSLQSSSSFALALGEGAVVAQWGDHFFSLKPSGWSSISIRSMGSRGPQAFVSSQGALGGRLDLLSGCAVATALGSWALIRPTASGSGLSLQALSRPAPGAQLVSASSSAGFDWIEWAMPDSTRAVETLRLGKRLAWNPDASLDWCAALGLNRALVQLSGEAFIATESGLSRLSGWAPSDAPAMAFQGQLWRAEVGEPFLKAYSVAQILAQTP